MGSLDSPDPWQRAEAVCLLARRDGRKHLDELARALSDPWPQVRVAAIRSLESLGGIAHSLLRESLVYEVMIPAGDFMMGGEEAEDRRPVRRFYLDTYYIDRYPVTNGDYRRFLDASPDYPKPDNWPEGSIPPGKVEHPTVYMNWKIADSYAKWAGKRLLTEAEWEKAARGGVFLDGDTSARIKNTMPLRRYPWGDELDVGKCNVKESGIGDTSPVGAYQGNGGDSPYGVSDMAGNVWEWVADWYSQGDHAEAPYRNPAGPSTGLARIMRGGSWYNEGDLARCTYCLPDVYPSVRFFFDGLRLGLAAHLAP